MSKYIKFFSIILIFSALSTNAQSQYQDAFKMYQFLKIVNDAYVDEPNISNLVEKGIPSILAELDPHSSYIKAKDVPRANEGLNGNIEGIGVTFQIIKDSIHVVEVVKGGPSEKVGLQPGDIITKVDGKNATGDSINNNFVMKNLRGKKGSVAKIEIKRRAKKDILLFDIVRDKIPLNSIDTYFMVDKKTGYIRLDRFSRTTMDEFHNAINSLEKQGMTQLIFDLRGNGGGFLDVAVSLADEFLPEGKLIVYTKDRNNKQTTFKSTSKGGFEKGRLIVLIDEYSASASEIVSGAIQDWDRGLVIGRRSFGKGLVQRMIPFNDGSQLRLTIARYYTPSGRCIQKPYKDGLEAYYNDLTNRYKHKELVNPDSISLPDSVKYYTNAKRVVYGGGGIVPDIFIPMDTVLLSDYWVNIQSKRLLNTFTVEWTEKHRNEILQKYPKYDDFDKAYSTFGIDQEFAKLVETEGVKKSNLRGDNAVIWINEYLRKTIKDTINPINESSYQNYVTKLLNNPKFQEEIMQKAKKQDEELNRSVEKTDIYINALLKAMIARDLYGTIYFGKATKHTDDGYKTAAEVINNDKLFKKHKIKY